MNRDRSQTITKREHKHEYEHELDFGGEEGGMEHPAI
jgi:hypothetical protein